MTGLEFLLSLLLIVVLTVASLTLSALALMWVWIACLPFGLYVLTRLTLRIINGDV